MTPTPHDLSGAQPSLLLTSHIIITRPVTIAWVSGAYKEPSPFRGPLVWVSVVLSNHVSGVGATISRVTLN